MSGGLEPVDSGLGEEGVGHEPEPLDRFSVGGDHRGGAAVAFNDEFVDIGGVDRVEGLQREVIDDEQIDAEEFADLDLVAVVEPAGSEAFEEPVAAFEVHASPPTDGGVSEGGSEERLADPNGSHDDGVVAGVDEPKRAQLGPSGPVVGDVGGAVPMIEGHGRVEPGGAGPPVS